MSLAIRNKLRYDLGSTTPSAATEAADDGRAHLSRTSSMKITMDSPMQLIYSPNYRVFKLFGHLPPELRRFIWALSLDTPGIHFLRLASKGSWKFLGIDNNTSLTNSQTYITPNGKRVCFDEIATEVAREKAPRSVRDMQLVSSTPWRSDVSYHRVTQRRLAVLSATCTESRSVADFMRSRKSALRLDNGLVVSLEGSNDVIFLEYMPRMYESTGINYTLRPYVPLLQGIRRLAVRFYHEWNTKTSERPCDNCREFHIAEADAVTPVHLYQFMARCLPSLTEFYFVDYFMPRKGNWPANAVSDQESNYPISSNFKVFYGVNRAFIEADNNHWVIQPKVAETLDWLENRFVRYATKSRFSRHDAPKEVTFRILGCEWSIKSPSMHRTAPSVAVAKGTNKRLFFEPRHVRKRSLSSPQPAPTEWKGVPEAGAVFTSTNNHDLKDFPFLVRCDTSASS